MFNPLMLKAVLSVHERYPDLQSVCEMGFQTLAARPQMIDCRTVPQLYRHLGMSYEALDIDERGTIRHDLNTVWKTKRTFDLVTNNGTSEHVFNQASVFETMHRICNRVMIHVLPWINFRNHGFYGYNPVLFHDLAEANGYDLIECYGGTRNGDVVYPVPGIENVKQPDATDKNVMLVAILEKTGKAKFVAPIQGKYRARI